jgi:Xaa-Pro aminopeptidase
MDSEIAQRLTRALAIQRLDALVGYSKENVAYGIGYVIPSQALGLRDRQFALAVNGDGRAGLLLTANEAEEARLRSKVDDLRPYDEFTEDPMEVLTQLLRELGVERGRVGIELDAFPADRWERLKRLLPDAQFVAGSPAFQEARMIKTSGELESLRAAARIADLAQLEARADIHEGMLERDLYRLVVDRALANGADSVLLVQVAAGERSGLSNPAPSDRPLRRGDVVKIDTFVSVNGYLSDTGRWIVIGQATDEQRRIWGQMQETMAALHEAIRPGVVARDLWQTFVREFARRDMQPAIRFLGHGLGLSLHEEPFVASHSETVIEEGMVLAIEPIYRQGEIGFHLEDNLIVTADGVENMTSRLGTELAVVG